MQHHCKRVLTLLVAMAMVLSLAVGASAANNQITVTLDERAISTTAYLDGCGRTQLPVSASAALGLTAVSSGTATTLQKNGRSITFIAGSTRADGVVMDTAAVEGYLPLKYVAEFFGYGLSWDDAQRTAAIVSPGTGSNDYRQDTLQKTRYGMLQGFAQAGALHWYGVPYAQAPVEALRWRAPEQLQPWTGTLQATKSLAASQTKSVQANKDAAGNGLVSASTELLGDEQGAVTLDITRPDTPEIGLPIFFYIHGGNNQTGRSSAFPATQFARETNAIVISVNHRLGLLGFNALPALKHGTPEENSGNFALLDLAAALDWVAENAVSFGGDPQRITVTGSSAGGRNVMAMLISPIFAGKFQKAISYSGGMTTSQVEDSQRVQARALAPLAVQKGLVASDAEGARWLLSDSEEVRAFLYSLSEEELAAAFGGAGIRMSAFPHLFADGIVLPKDGFDTTKYNAVPILMVNGDREFSTFCKSTPPFDVPTASELMQDEVLLPQYRFAEKYGSMMYGYFNGEESAVRMLNHYTAPIYTCTIRWGDDAAVVGEELATIYGSYHCMTTPLMTHVLTNASTGYPEQYASNSCKAVSSMLNSYYKNFLWSGDPNGTALPNWAPWSSLKGSTQLIVDGNEQGAWAEMSTEHTSYEEILAQMDADTSISSAQKKALIQTVLNGRWFSETLDAQYQNPNLWR